MQYNSVVNKHAPDHPASWFDYLIDALEADEPAAPIDNVQLVEADTKIDRKLISHYFNSHVYPYATRMDLRDYYVQKLALQIELVKLQNWVQDAGQRIVLVFEGRDAAGKGSTIKRFMEHLNPRWARVVAPEKPTDEERGQWYFQRYVKDLPSRGEMVLFDRSWYNRAGVERVMGFCTQKEYEDFIEQAPSFEKMLVKSGISLIKFYLSVSRKEQARRFDERKINPLKQWKLSPIDLEAQHKWDDYTEAKNAILETTDSTEAPWIIIKTEDKMRARLEIMRFVLNHFDYPDKDECLAQPDPLIVAHARSVLVRGKSHVVD